MENVPECYSLGQSHTLLSVDNNEGEEEITRDEMVQTQNGEDEDLNQEKVLKEFVRLREKPSIFFCLQDSLDEQHLDKLQSELLGQYFEGVKELDFVIHSFGGNPNIAYQVIELLRHHTAHQGVSINACVPRYAKSAATLLCLGADKIVVHEIAELGPLDTQLYEKSTGGERLMTSTITPFEALKQIRKFSLESLDDAVKMFVMRSGMSLVECSELAIKFVKILTEPLLMQIEPEKVGEYSRALTIGMDYGERLLRRYSVFDEGQRREVLNRLVYSYPSHDYVIDYNELDDLGFDVELFEDYKQDQAVENLRQLIRQNEEDIIQLVMPGED